MKYLNLKAEMAKKDVSIERIAEILNIHRNSASRKVNGLSSFSIEEAVLVRDAEFPALELVYLFKKYDE